MLLDLTFLALLAAGVGTDVMRRRIPNGLVLLLLVPGLGLSLVGVPGLPAGWSALAGVGVGLLCWIPFWLLGLLGAGDVKYFAAASAWLGPALTWRSAVVAALLGGVFSLLLLARRAGARGTLHQLAFQGAHARALVASADVVGGDAAARTVPYAVPMALALALAALRPSVLLGWILP